MKCNFFAADHWIITEAIVIVTDSRTDDALIQTELKWSLKRPRMTRVSLKLGSERDQHEQMA